MKFSFVSTVAMGGALLSALYYATRLGLLNETSSIKHLYVASVLYVAFETFAVKHFESYVRGNSLENNELHSAEGDQKTTDDYFSFDSDALHILEQEVKSRKWWGF